MLCRLTGDPLLGPQHRRTGREQRDVGAEVTTPLTRRPLAPGGRCLFPGGLDSLCTCDPVLHNTCKVPAESGTVSPLGLAGNNLAALAPPPDGVRENRAEVVGVMAVESLGPGSAGEGVLLVFLACVYPELWLE